MINKIIKLTIVSSLLFSPISLVAANQIINLTPGKAAQIDDTIVTCRSGELISMESIETYKKMADLKNEFCDQLLSSSNKEECYSLKIKYIDSQAISICKGDIILESSKMECLKNIKNKVYSNREIKLVKDSISTSKKLDLLKRLGESL